MSMLDQANRNSINLESTQRMVDQGVAMTRMDFSPAYIDAVFAQWYSLGKISMKRLTKMTPDPIDFGLATGRPSEHTLLKWRTDHFLERAARLDEEVTRQLSERLIAEKVQMLNAHAAIASEMQMMALAYLRASPDKLNSNTALRLLVEGVRIERESRGIPRTLEKMSEKSDEDLLAQIEDMLLRAPATMEPLEDED